MIKLPLIFLCSFIIVLDVISQQDPQYSQYMFNHLAVNPGYAGAREIVCVSGVHRQQWVGIPGAPITSVFTVNMPFNININIKDEVKATNHGLGLIIMQDRIGFDNNISLGVDYAFRFSPGIVPGKIGIGIGGMYLDKRFIKDAEWHIPDGDWQTDPAIPDPIENNSINGFDLGFGIFYRTESIYLGISSSHLYTSPLNYKKGENDVNYKLKTHLYVTVGCVLPLENPAWEISPSLLAYSDLVASQFTANVNMTYNKKVWAGVGYRMNDAIIAMIGFDLFSGVKIGYAFDYTLSNFRTIGSHEVMVNYCFSLVREKVVKKYKSVRFL